MKNIIIALLLFIAYPTMARNNPHHGCNRSHMYYPHRNHSNFSFNINLNRFNAPRGHYEIQHIRVWIPEKYITYIDSYGNQAFHVIPGYWKIHTTKVWVNY